MDWAMLPALTLSFGLLTVNWARLPYKVEGAARAQLTVNWPEDRVRLLCLKIK